MKTRPKGLEKALDTVLSNLASLSTQELDDLSIGVFSESEERCDFDLQYPPDDNLDDVPWEQNAE